MTNIILKLVIIFLLLVTIAKQDRDMNKIRYALKTEAESSSIEKDVKTLCEVYGLNYPEAKIYLGLFHDIAQKYEIDWRIYPAIIWIESGFRCNLKSHKGAIGICQVMPATFKETAAKLGIKYRPDETEWNEILNIAVGMSYLSERIARKGIMYGVTAYFAGDRYKDSQETIRYFEMVLYQYNMMKICFPEKE